MSWETITGITARVHLRLFGNDVTLKFNDESELKTKAVLTPHMTHLSEHNNDFESYALIASVFKKDVSNPQNLIGIVANETQYQIIPYKLEADGFYVFFLSE